MTRRAAALLALAMAVAPTSSAGAAEDLHCASGATVLAGNEVCAAKDRSLERFRPVWTPSFPGAMVARSIARAGDRRQVGFVESVDAPLADVMAFYAARFQASGGGTEIRRPERYLAIASRGGRHETIGIARRPWADGRNDIRIEVTVLVAPPVDRDVR